jgi:predicted nuclease with TOPRIM domain
LKCNKKHECCNNCFDTAVNFSIKLHISAVACPVFSCDSSFSEEIVEDNVTVKIYKKLFSLSSSSEMMQIKEKLKENEEVIKRNEEVIKNKDAQLEKLNKDNEDLKKEVSQLNYSSSSSSFRAFNPSKNFDDKFQKGYYYNNNNNKKSNYIEPDNYIEPKENILKINNNNNIKKHVSFKEKS